MSLRLAVYKHWSPRMQFCLWKSSGNCLRFNWV